MNKIKERNRLNKAIKILNTLILKQAELVNNFQEGGKDIKFDDINSLESEYTEIEKGVKVKILKGKTSNIIKLKCIMEKDSELGIHKHSDYIEFFQIEKGSLLEKITNTVIDDTYTFYPNVWHNLQAIDYTEMLITCTYNNKSDKIK